jgi:hypothetical protein
VKLLMARRYGAYNINHEKAVLNHHLPYLLEANPGADNCLTLLCVCLSLISCTARRGLQRKIVQNNIVGCRRGIATVKTWPVVR